MLAWPRLFPIAGYLALALTLAASPRAGEDGFTAARLAMVRTIEANAFLAGGAAVPTALDPAVLDVMNRVPRHEFVPDELRGSAYEDRPLPIGYGQTISQPYIVALMTDLLALKPGARVLEIGTGSGYHAAVLAELAVEVYTIEIIPPLAAAAAERFTALGYHGVKTRQGDGYYGWPEAAPFDGILVTAAVPLIPPPLVKQLKRGGRLIAPVGPPFLVQHLVLVEKALDGTVRTEALLPVHFVPLVREAT